MTGFAHRKGLPWYIFV